jgi:hypothetical protein
MRGRGGWPAPCAQSISWRRLKVDRTGSRHSQDAGSIGKIVVPGTTPLCRATRSSSYQLQRYFYLSSHGPTASGHLFQPIDPVHVSPPISVGRIGSFSTGASHLWNEPNASSEFGADPSNQMVRSRFKICGEDGAHLLCRRRKDGSEGDGERRRPLGLLLAAPEAWPPPHRWIPRRSIFTANACSFSSLPTTPRARLKKCSTAFRLRCIRARSKC